jgi:hypothetical protein
MLYPSSSVLAVFSIFYNIFTGTRPFTALPAFYELLND